MTTCGEVDSRRLRLAWRIGVESRFRQQLDQLEGVGAPGSFTLLVLQEVVRVRRECC